MRVVKQLLVVAMFASLVACRGEKQLSWSDDFSDPSSGWQAQSDASAEVSYSDGVMRILVKWPNSFAWASARREFSDYRLAVEATQIAGPDDNEYGVHVRMKDNRHLYRFSISGDGYYRIVRLDDEQETVLGSDWSYSEAIRTGMAVNRLEVTCQDATMTFRVNDVLLAQVEDDTHRKGDIGLYAGSFFEPGVEIHFDNLTVSEP